MSAPTLSPAPARSASADAPRTIPGLLRLLLSRNSPRILIALVLAFGGVRLGMGSWAWGDALVAAALLAWWPFQEWLIHVFLLHRKPTQLGPFTIDPMQARKHRRHHLAPWDLSDVSIPVHTYGYAVPILCLLGWVSWPNPLVFTGLTVYAFLGLHYEWCHFMAHSNYTPRSRYYKAIWRNHRLHHFKNETLWMGVSTHVGDMVLGTCPDQKQVERSDTCRTLGISSPLAEAS